MLFDRYYLRGVWREWSAIWRQFWMLDPPQLTPSAPRVVPPPEAPVLGKWIALRTGGGGKFETAALFEDAAIEYVTRGGSHSIVAIDRVNRYIFYADKR